LTGRDCLYTIPRIGYSGIKHREADLMTELTEVLSEAEIKAMFEHINTSTASGARNYALLQLMAQAGVRCGEALKATVGDLRREDWPGMDGKVWVLRLPARATKRQRERIGIPLSVETVAALQLWEAWREKLGINGAAWPLFGTISEGKRRAGFSQGEGELVRGRALDGRYVRELVRRLAQEAGIERRVHPHMLRHTALTALYDRTQDLRMVQTVAGHASSTMTERYAHVHPTRLAQAMGAEGGTRNVE